MHAEAAPGQFEVVTAHWPAPLAADRLLLTREAIHAVAARHGLLACFLPKPLPSAPGNGCHLHMSLWEGGVNLLGGGEACGEAVWDAFFAGANGRKMSPGTLRWRDKLPRTARACDKGRLLRHTSFRRPKEVNRAPWRPQACCTTSRRCSR